MECYSEHGHRRQRSPHSHPVCRQAYYFANEDTGETAWEAPALEAETGGVPPGAVVAAAAAGVHPLPDGAGETTTALTCWAGSDDDGHETMEEQALVTAADESQFPFYVNERGNRVFCVPRKAGS